LLISIAAFNQVHVPGQECVSDATVI